MLLSEYADIKSGLLLSRKLAKSFADSKQMYKQVTLKSINADGTIDMSLIEDYPASDIVSPSYLTREGDVLVRLTEPYTAVLITKEYENLVFSSHFIVIRTNDKKLDSGYLAWLLNDDSTKIQLKKNESGTALALIKRSNYENLKIEQIPLSKQKQIADINMLLIKEANLLRQLAEQKILLSKSINKSIYDKETK